MKCHTGKRVGAHYLGGGRCEFTVWAPLIKEVALKVLFPEIMVIPMNKDARGYWKVIENVHPQATYVYIINGEYERPDPASCYQPEGVHGPSQVVDHSAFSWRDENWRGVPLHEMIMYEVHVGTFTPEGTFSAIVPRLDELRELGINAIEVMPVAQFPGERNWGYDGAYPFAVQNSYGGPEGFRNLVNECHEKGMALILDVVYNHLGPEGNYLRDFGPYFTPKYHTPWGDAMNFDEAFSGGVRNFFTRNALHWFANYHVDALRIDAIHGITDMSAVPFLQELASAVRKYSSAQRKKLYLIAESDLNDSKVIRPEELGGFGMDAQWCDDFHHSVHSLLTGEAGGYYADFGKMRHLAKSLREGFVYTGEYSVFRKRKHGNSARDRQPCQFVAFLQNHDQVGNRMCGERLTSIVSFEVLKLAAGILFISPFIPFLFMGEEYGEKAPFLYFTSHSDQKVIEAVREGRKEEFRDFGWHRNPPDPHSAETFLKSKIHWDDRRAGHHGVLLDFYRQLIDIRKTIPAFDCCEKEHMEVWHDEDRRIITVNRWNGESSVLSVFDFNNTDVKLTLSIPEGRWEKVLDSAEKKWNGPGTLLPVAVHAGDEITMRRESFAVFLLKG